MQLSHSRNNGLARLIVEAPVESRILFSQLLKRISHALLVSLRAGLESNTDNWLREGNPLKQNRCLRIAKRIASEGLLEAYRCTNAPCI